MCALLLLASAVWLSKVWCLNGSFRCDALCGYFKPALRSSCNLCLYLCFFLRSPFFRPLQMNKWGKIERERKKNKNHIESNLWHISFCSRSNRTLRLFFSAEFNNFTLSRMSFAMALYHIKRHFFPPQTIRRNTITWVTLSTTTECGPFPLYYSTVRAIVCASVSFDSVLNAYLFAILFHCVFSRSANLLNCVH